MSSNERWRVKRRRFFEAVGGIAFLAGCSAVSEDGVNVTGTSAEVTDRRCDANAEGTATVAFDERSDAVTVSGAMVANSRRAGVDASVFTTNGGDGPAGDDSVILRMTSDGGHAKSTTRTRPAEGDCTPVLGYAVEVRFDRLPVDVLVDHDVRGVESDGFVAHATLPE